MAGLVVEVLVEAGWAELRDHAGRFGDVDSTDVWADHIETFAALGITDGCSRAPAKYCPDRAVTRGQMAVFLVRAFDLPEPSGPVRAFSDISVDHRFGYAISRLAAAGVTVGFPDGTYRPDAEVSRRHMAVFLRRAAGYVWGQWTVEWTNSSWPSGCEAGLRHTTTGEARNAAVPCGAVIEAGDAVSVIGFGRRLEAWADAAACDRLRYSNHGATYPAPKRVEVTAVSVSFDDLPAPGERHIPEFGAEPNQRFVDELLAVVEVQLEALSHGRTDWVFRRGGEVHLGGSAHARARPASLDRQTLGGYAPELRALFPDDEVLLAFHTNTTEFPYVGFYSFDGVAGVHVRPEDDPSPETYPGLEWVSVDAETWASIDAYGWSDHRFRGALFTAAHELLHHLGLDDLYATMPDDGRGPPDRGGQSSLMGMSGYGWGLYLQLTAERIQVSEISVDQPSARFPHEPLTGWNKWLLGWLDGPEALCVPTGEKTTLTVRPHQRTTLQVDEQWSPSWCWRHSSGHWGPAAPDPVIAIIPTSDTTAVVIEADPFAAQGRPQVPQCFFDENHELPYSQHQCTAPPDHRPRDEENPTRHTRPVGDIIVYDVDLTTRHRPQLLVNPTVAVVSPAKHEQVAPLYAATGAFGMQYAPGGRYANSPEIRRGPWPHGLPIQCYYLTEVTVHGYRIAVADSTITDAGLPQVTVTIEPVN